MQPMLLCASLESPSVCHAEDVMTQFRTEKSVHLYRQELNSNDEEYAQQKSWLFVDPWSVLWNPCNSAQFVVGCSSKSRNAALVDVESEKWLTAPNGRNQSDVFAQAISPSNEKIIVNGTRNGLLWIWLFVLFRAQFPAYVTYFRDVRASKRSMEEPIVHAKGRQNRRGGTSTVKHIVLCRNMIHLIRQHSNGELSIFDLRTHRKLTQLTKPSKHAMPMIRFDIDSTESLIACVDPLGMNVVKFYELNSGKLFSTLKASNAHESAVEQVHLRNDSEIWTVMENILCTSLAEIGISVSDFADVCERCSRRNELSHAVVNQILSMDDFLIFKKLMVKRNLELELEAIQAFREDQIGEEEMEELVTQLMELSILYKEEEVEQADLDAAIAISTALHKEHVRLINIYDKSAEDASLDERNASLDERNAQRNSLERLEDEKHNVLDFQQKNKQVLQETAITYKELHKKAEISEDDIKRREAYLRKQRDQIVEKKRKQREKSLNEYQQQHKSTLNEMPVEIADNIKASAKEPADPKSVQNEEKRSALRVALARRMKQDLLESAGQDSCSMQVYQLSELDEKMDRVEKLRSKAQEKEKHVRAGLKNGRKKR
ncbi:unnamed protein product [Albugo candida]|uniref:Cilia- and flagella-associated protein 36 n=1 Tax=Albugo candida TaxID=65357 RepID=A0A024GK06_9STRA|nr:unnamed protein product [Albugo candida]|eukprot:CCI47216.1 unnamed protein product [Albugo candida]